MLSSSALACSSKLNLRHMRLRSARPQALLMREPCGEWITRWVSPISSKKRSNTMRLRGGQHAERGLRGAEVQRELLRRRPRAGRARRAASARRPPRPSSSSSSARAAQARHRMAQLVGAAQALAEPERHRWRLAPGVLDQHLAGLDLDDAVRRIAELEDVARQALEREVFVQRADAVFLGQQHHVVVELVGDHAGVGHRRQPRATARAQHAVHRVVVQVGAAPAAPRGVAVGQHLHHLLELGERQVAVRVGEAAALEQRIERPLLACGLGDDLLRQRIQRLVAARGCDRARRAAPHRAARRTPAGRRGPAGTAAPSGSRRSRGRRGRPAAGMRSPSAASRAGRPGRCRRCRCRAPASWWPPAPSARPTSGAARRRAGARAPGCRGAR